MLFFTRGWGGGGGGYGTIDKKSMIYSKEKKSGSGWTSGWDIALYSFQFRIRNNPNLYRVQLGNVVNFVIIWQSDDWKAKTQTFVFFACLQGVPINVGNKWQFLYRLYSAWHYYVNIFVVVF